MWPGSLMFLTKVSKNFIHLARCIETQRRTLWTSSEIYSGFLYHFKSLGYKFFPPCPVLTPEGSTTFYVNAGMNQYRPIFLNEVDPDSDLASLRKVMNSQRCVRAGGKHNDMMEVGLDGTHHTYFEMLGHWSFRQPAEDRTGCAHALTLLTDLYRIPLDHLTFTFFGGDQRSNLPPDTVSRDYWLSLGVDPGRIESGPMKDNFWQMADTGPCGPCTEIHYQPSDSHEPLELWNLVFMQYNRKETGDLEPLAACHMDTGMGLERLCAILNGKTSNYDTDIFAPILEMIQDETGAEPYSSRFGANDQSGTDTAYRILSDHARMYTVTIADGAVPQASGKHYVLKKILRRAAYYASVLTRLGGTQGTEVELLSKLPEAVASSLSSRFPQDGLPLAQIRDIVRKDAEQGIGNLDKTRKLYQKVHKHNHLNCLSDIHRYNRFGLTEEVVNHMAKYEFNIAE